MLKTKQCTLCAETKTLSEFLPKKSNSDGLMCHCEPCGKTYRQKQVRSKNGVVTQLYGNQKHRIKTKGYIEPLYSKDELREWLYDQDLFHKLHQEWSDSGYQKKLSISVDRLDDYKGYTFDNIQLGTWEQNNQNGHDDRRNGLNNKNSKSIIQYTLDGEFVAEHYSQHQASRDTGVPQGNITRVCSGKYKQAGGYIWNFKGATNG